MRGRKKPRTKGVGISAHSHTSPPVHTAWATRRLSRTIPTAPQRSIARVPSSHTAEAIIRAISPVEGEAAAVTATVPSMAAGGGKAVAADEAGAMAAATGGRADTAPSTLPVASARS